MTEDVCMYVAVTVLQNTSKLVWRERCRKTDKVGKNRYTFLNVRAFTGLKVKQKT